jgi:hypothetical protein
MLRIRKEALLTAQGQRSVLRELSYNLSDKQITRMLSAITVDILVDEEGPWVVIPQADTVRGGDTEMCLAWEDVDEADERPEWMWESEQHEERGYE